MSMNASDYFSKKQSQLLKENTSPQRAIIQKSCQRSILNTHGTKRLTFLNASASTVTPPEPPAVAMTELTSQSLTHLPLKRRILPSHISRRNMSMSDVSEMLMDFYNKANVANAPKNPQSAVGTFSQTSPASAEGNEPSSIAVIATKSASAVIKSNNLDQNVMAETAGLQKASDSMAKKVVAAENLAFHHTSEGANSINVATTSSSSLVVTKTLPALSAIPTSVVVSPQIADQVDVKPIINPTTGEIISAFPSTSCGGGSSVIKTIVPISDSKIPSLVPLSSAIDRANTISDQNNRTANSSGVINQSDVDVLPPAAVIAAALFRDGYNNFQQQLRTQELAKVGNVQEDILNTNTGDNSTVNTISSKLLENLLRQRRLKSDNVQENTADADTMDGDDEDDSRYNDFDDIHLVENSKPNYNCSMPGLFQSAAISSSSPKLNATSADYMSDDSQKFMMAAQAQALRHLEYSLADIGHSTFGMIGNNDNSTQGSGNESTEPNYECRHCGKKYRWKSTLRRHESVECGGKEPSHQCPYCPYKSKQRGNLGVHVRKHHSDLPQLTSKRRSKYSNKLESGNISANASDDSSSKLVIDCSK
ncbi:uncharacterized protein LOC101461413 [Ceratitis capitata]|nr:uncharacterized protein LOC101461413 [Ceratitis capitata]